MQVTSSTSMGPEKLVAINRLSWYRRLNYESHRIHLAQRITRPQAATPTVRTSG
jgi:hypothetical protein